MAQLKRKGPIVFLTFLSLITVFSQVLRVYELAIPPLLIGLIAGFCLIIGFVPYYSLKCLLGIVSFIFSLYTLLPLDEPLSLQWMTALFDKMIGNFQAFFTGASTFISQDSAIPLLLLVLLLLAVLMIQFERFLFSYFLMVSYLLVLSVFHTDNLSSHLALLLICGILSRTFRQKSLPPKLFIGVILVFLVVGFSAIQLTNSEIRTVLTNWTSPIRNFANQQGLYNWIQRASYSSTARTGFSENDQQLGGALLDDSTILFEVTQKDTSYWRVESKDFYTGKGWENTNQVQTWSRNRQAPLVVETQQSDQYYKAPEASSSRYFNHGTYLPLPYGNSSITVTEGSTNFIRAEETGRVDFGGSNQTERGIHNQWSPPDYQLKALENIPITHPIDASVDYLQLPNSLPARIGERAHEIIGSETSLIKQVTAIENYLKNNDDFRYSKIDAASPTDDQDYIDQFLFETKVGYCDNFSSSMVILLRTLGIPTRWTKGFAPGDQTLNTNGETTFTIRNLHAHSWVEVYFAGFGWLPFEPTPSFTNPSQPEAAEESTAPNSAVSESSVDASDSSSQNQATSSTLADGSEHNETTDQEGLPRFLIPIILIGSAAVAILLFQKYLLRIRVSILKKITRQPLRKIYPLLLKKMEKNLARDSSETLSDYAKRVEKKESGLEGAFLKLTEDYEKLLYGQPTTLNFDHELVDKIIFYIENKKTARE
ncbi:MAG: transglutaminase domain-containing protein [Enterococcus sp.]|nr:transglutaminase domain-containing protein [Enterococcus sp.]